VPTIFFIHDFQNKQDTVNFQFLWYYWFAKIVDNVITDENVF